MKPFRTLWALAFFFVASVLPRAVAQAVTYDAFATSLQTAIRLDDQKGLDRLIKANSTHTIGHFRALVQGMVADPAAEPRTRAEREAIKASWTRVFQGRTLEILENWLQLLDSKAASGIERARLALNQVYGELARLQSGVKERKPWESLADSTRKIAEQFQGVGDDVQAADAWGVVARIYTAIPDRTIGDREEAIVALVNFEERRRAVDFVKDDFFYGNVEFRKAEEERLVEEKKQADKRSKDGYDVSVKGADAYLMPDADKLEQIVDLRFEVATKPHEDMSPVGGSIPPKWLAVSILNSGPEKMAWFRATELFLVRPASNKFGITLDGAEVDLKKNPFLEIEAGNKLKKPSLFWLDKDRQFPYAMWFYVGGASEPYQGLGQNLEPYEQGGIQRATLYYKSAASWVADVAGTPVTLFDENGSGTLFEGDPMEFGLKDRGIGAGPDEEVAIPAFDAMQIGKGPMMPFGQWVKIGEAWYHLRGHDGGRKLGVRPANPEYLKTGTIALKWTGPKSIKPTVLIVQGKGDFATARFQIADGKPMEVPAGDYSVAYGRIEQKGGGKVTSADIFPGAFQPVTVAEGGAAVLELGAPFTIDFDKKVADGKLTLDSVKFRVFGKSKELYGRLNGCVVTPTVLVGRTADGKGAKDSGEFVPIPDTEILNQLATKFGSTLASHVGFFPIPKGARDTTVLEVPVAGEVFVGLADRKNKFFGKIDPIFK
ncbi:MAG: hypothetical protein AB7I19_02240 [Planctomycetota bacterium]